MIDLEQELTSVSEDLERLLAPVCEHVHLNKSDNKIEICLSETNNREQNVMIKIINIEYEELKHLYDTILDRSYTSELS